MELLLSQIQFENVSLVITTSLVAILGGLLFFLGLAKGSKGLSLVGAVMCLLGIVGYILATSNFVK